MPLQVAVCGPRHCTEQDQDHAYRVGQLLAQHGAVVICGGGVGVMAAVTAGARSAGGTVIGIYPGDSREGACDDLSATIVTNLGEARNAIIAASADAVIAIGGSCCGGVVDEAWPERTRVSPATAREFLTHNAQRPTCLRWGTQNEE